METAPAEASVAKMNRFLSLCLLLAGAGSALYVIERRRAGRELHLMTLLRTGCI